MPPSPALTKQSAIAESLPAQLPPRVQAKLSLAFEYNEPARSTILASSCQEPPLKVVRAFPQQNGATLVHLHNVSGGLLGGDRLSLNVRIGAAATVQLTTTSATRIYRPRQQAATTEQSTEITLAENALLEYIPDAIIPFAGARYEQRTRISLASGAGLFWWEILAPGREASGEIFAYESVEMHAEISAAGPPHRNRTRPPRSAPSRPHLPRAPRSLSLLGHVLHLPRRPASRRLASRRKSSARSCARTNRAQAKPSGRSAR